MTTGERIKKLRLELGLSQEELGEKIGVKNAAIYKYESGLVVNLKRSTIAKLADALHTTPAYLMGWENEMSQQTASDSYLDNPAKQAPVLEHSDVDLSLMDYLKKLRLEKGDSQQTVASYLGITRQAYSNYENGNRTPDYEMLLKLAEYFGTTVDVLLRGKENTPILPEERKLKLLARHLNKIPDEQREKILKNFEDSIDIYLDALGIPKEDE